MALAGHCARAQDFLKGEGTARQVIEGVEMRSVDKSRERQGCRIQRTVERSSEQNLGVLSLPSLCTSPILPSSLLHQHLAAHKPPKLHPLPRTPSAQTPQRPSSE